MSMEELSEEELEEVLKAPQPRERKPKKIERTLHSWFYDIHTFLGKCENPDCKDNRKKNTVYVYTHPDIGLDMCRICWLDGWLKDG